MKSLSFAIVLMAGTVAFAQTSASPATQGCLSSADGSFSLRDSSGQNFKLTGDTANLKDHVGHTVKISGSTDASNQTIKVDGVTMVSETCAASSAAAEQPATEPTAEASVASSDQPAASPEPAASASPASETQPTATASSASTTAMDPVVSPAPEATATASTTTTASSENFYGQTPAATTADVNANAPVAAETTASDPVVMAQNNTDATATQSDATAAVPQSDQAEVKSEELPETASPLPLLGLLGFGSLATGWFVRRK